MRILCIADSLALPREGCPYESTWFFKLKEAYPQHEFIHYFKRGLLIKEALEQFDLYYKYYEPDIVVLQTGVCDCAPRYINDKRSIWKLLIKICISLGCESLFWKIVKLRGRSENCVYTKFEFFTQAYDTLIKNFVQENIGVNKIYAILIGKSTETIIKKNHLFNENVNRYNNAIISIAERYKEKVEVLSPLGIPTDDIFTDGYHCNEKGMTRVFKELKEKIDSFNSV